MEHAVSACDDEDVCGCNSVAHDIEDSAGADAQPQVHVVAAAAQELARLLQCSHEVLRTTLASGFSRKHVCKMRTMKHDEAGHGNLNATSIASSSHTNAPLCAHRRCTAEFTAPTEHQARR